MKCLWPLEIFAFSPCNLRNITIIKGTALIFLRFAYLKGRGTWRQRRQKWTEKSSICWFTIRHPDGYSSHTGARLDPGARISVWISHLELLATTQALGHPLLPSQAHSQEAGWAASSLDPNCWDDTFLRDGWSCGTTKPAQYVQFYYYFYVKKEAVEIDQQVKNKTQQEKNSEIQCF